MWLLSALSQSTSVSRDIPKYVVNCYMIKLMQHISLCCKQLYAYSRLKITLITNYRTRECVEKGERKTTVNIKGNIRQAHITSSILISSASEIMIQFSTTW